MQSPIQLLVFCKEDIVWISSYATENCFNSPTYFGMKCTGLLIYVGFAGMLEDFSEFTRVQRNNKIIYIFKKSMLNAKQDK